MSKGGKNQTVTTTPDPMTQAYMKQVYGRALAAGSQPYTPYGGQRVAGVSDLTPEAISNYQQAAKYGNLGMGAAAGDPTAVASMMNPYASTMDPIWDQMRSKAVNAVGSNATAAHAFGGSRQGVAEGQASADVTNGQAQQRYGEYSDAMSRAMQLANMGMGANGALFGAGDYLRNIQQQGLDTNYNDFLTARDWDVRNLGILTGAMGGPSGSVQTTPLQRNAGAGALGGAAQGAAIGSVIPGVGTAVGAGVGGLLGLMG